MNKQQYIAAIVESSQDAIIGIDLHNTICFWNNGATQIYGYVNKDVVGQSIKMLLSPSTTDHFISLVRLVNQGTDITNHKMMHLTKDKKNIMVLFSISQVKGQDGNLLGVSLIAKDISKDIYERKRAEARLTAEHAVTKILAASNSLSEAALLIINAIRKSLEAEIGQLWLFDRKQNYLKCSVTSPQDIPTYLKKFYKESYKMKSFLGVGLPGQVWNTCSPSWYTNFAFSNKIEFPRAPLAAEAGLRSAMAFPISTDKEFFGVMEFFTRKSVEPDRGLLDMMAAVGSEIGQFIHHRNAEEEVGRLNRDLKRRLDELQTLLNVAPIGIAVAHDPRCQTLTINPAAAQILSLYPQLQTAQQPTDNNLTLSPVDTDNKGLSYIYTSLQFAMKNALTIHNLEIDIKGNDDKACNILQYASPLYDEFQEVRGGLGVFIDITSRKEAEEVLKASTYQYAVLAELGQHALAGMNPDVLMKKAVSFIVENFRLEYSAVFEFIAAKKSLLLRTAIGWVEESVKKVEMEITPNSLAYHTLFYDTPLILEDLRSEVDLVIPSFLSQANVTSGVFVAIPGFERPFGILCAFSHKKRPFKIEEVHLLQSIANIIAAAMERKLNEESRGCLLERIILAQEEERKSLSRELHDEIGPSLSALLVSMRMIERAQTVDEAKQKLAALRESIITTLNNLKRLARGLHPSVLDDLGLKVALEHYANNYAEHNGMNVSVFTERLSTDNFTPSVEIALYRIAQEALTNIATHANAKNVQIILENIASGVKLIIKDDGCGFDVETARRTSVILNHLGLYSMRERAALLGGIMTINSTNGAGTEISINIPLTTKNEKL